MNSYTAFILMINNVGEVLLTSFQKKKETVFANLKVHQMFVKVMFLPARFPCFIVHVNRQDVGT